MGFTFNEELGIDVDDDKGHANTYLDRQVAQNELISLIELNLTPLPGLPAELHTTNGLPSYLMATLKLEVLESKANGRKDKDRVIEGVVNSSIILDTKTVGSTIFVSFGSGYFLSEVDLTEIAKGLELSTVNFIWELRFSRGQLEGNFTIEQVLPQGFHERVQNRGLVVKGWTPQAKILAHKNVGGFVSHCGWSYVIEAMKFGVPIIPMPMQLDEPVNSAWELLEHQIS
ncbi:beta-D-glucosyl crocetin beta-1,6-glucosyltransferase-like protein [Tanacetum coccineum]